MKNNSIEKNALRKFREFLKSDFTKTTEANLTHEPWHGAPRGHGHLFIKIE